MSTESILPYAVWLRIRQYCKHRVQDDGTSATYHCEYTDPDTGGGYSGPCDYTTCPIVGPHQTIIKGVNE